MLDAARALAEDGVELTLLDSDSNGFVSPGEVDGAIRDDTALVSVMHVNNEIGTIQDIRAIADLCRARDVPLHVDAAQSAGKVPLDIAGWGIDLCSLTAHKIYGPKGVGALYVRDGLTLEPLFHGGDQERHMRAGTLATHQVVGMGKAYAMANVARDAEALGQLRDHLWQGLAGIGGVTRNGAEPCAPHILNVSFPGVDGESLRLSLVDIAVSAGSACASDSPDASHVLSGLGLSDARAQSSLRFGVGRYTTQSEVERAAARVASEVARLRAIGCDAPDWCSG